MKRIIQVAAFCFFFLSQNTFANNPDSLRKVLAQQQAAARLPTLVRLCESEYKSVISNEEARLFAQEIFKWATASRDSAAQIKGCLCIVTNQDNSSGTSDSPFWLEKAGNLAKNQPELMADVLFRWTNYYAELGKSDSARLFIHRAIDLCEKHQLRSKQSFLMAVAAKMYSNGKKTTTADSLLKLAFRLCQNAKDSAVVFSNLGSVQKDFGHPEEAAKAFLKAYQLSIQQNNWIVAAFNLNQYATILRDEGKHDQAIRYLEEVIELSKRAQYAATLASAYNSLGVLYQKSKEYEKSLEYYRLALSLKKEMGRPKKILNTIRNMAELYIFVGQNDASLALCRQYLPLSKEIKYVQIETQLTFLAAMAAAKMGKKIEAQQYVSEGEKALLNMKIVEELPETYQLAAQTYSTMGNFKQAYQYQILFQNARDSISNAEKSRTITEMETRYATQKKEQQIAVLAKDNQLKQTQQYASIGGLFLLTILAVLLWRNNLNRQRHNAVLAQTNGELTQKNNEVQTLLREIHHRVKNNLQIISSLLRLQARRVVDEGAIEALRTGQSRVRSMAMLHERLYQGDTLKSIPMRSYLSDLVQSLFDAYRTDEDRITLTTDFDDVTLDIDTAVPIGLIANELITNTLKYAFPDDRQGEIHLKLIRETTHFKFLISDNGIGIPLSIDGKPVTKRTSFGLELVESLTKKLNGTLIFANDNGTKIELTVPLT